MYQQQTQMKPYVEDWRYNVNVARVSDEEREKYALFVIRKILLAKRRRKNNGR